MADIIIVEPDTVLGVTYAAALRGDGHQVQHLRNAQAAIHAADSQTPDIIILEIQMAAHSGIEFLYELRSYPEWQSIPVIILSNVPPHEFQTSQRALYQHLGVEAYLYKPRTDLQHLIATVQAAVLVAL